MKLIKTGTFGTGNTRFEFHAGVEELQILHGLIKNSLRHMPAMIQTLSLRHRMLSMSVAFKEALEKQGFDTKEPTASPPSQGVS